LTFDYLILKSGPSYRFCDQLHIIFGCLDLFTLALIREIERTDVPGSTEFSAQLMRMTTMTRLCWQNNRHPVVRYKCTL